MAVTNGDTREKAKGGAPARAKAPPADEGLPVARDRSVPGWVPVLAGLSAGAGALLLFAAVIVAAVSTMLIVRQGLDFLAPVLAVLAALVALGGMVIELAGIRALAGWREARERAGRRVRAWLGVAFAAALAAVHPVLVAPAAAVLAVVVALGRFGIGWRFREAPWDFRRDEAIPLLAGRDREGLRLAGQTGAGDPRRAPLMRAAPLGAAVATAILASWLDSRLILTEWAVAASALAGGLVVQLVAPMALLLAGRSVIPEGPRVTELPTPEDEGAVGPEGLVVSGLSVAIGGRRLLKEVSFRVRPGEIVVISGESGAGKSLLLAALADPFGLPGGADVRGHASVNGRSLWRRGGLVTQLPAVHVPPAPLLLPASGEENLAAFQGGMVATRARAILEELVFSTDRVSRVVGAADARVLPAADRKALALARAFLLSPAVYLIDRPEDGADETMLSALVNRIRAEQRAGRSFLIITGLRALQEMSDTMITLLDGRIVDHGRSEEVLGCGSSGWKRMSAPRRLESEDMITSWIRTLFRRKGDEGNRRRVALVAGELLAFSCQDADPVAEERILIEFKHFEGYCVMRLIDDGAIPSSAQLELARQQAREEDDERRRPPLVELMRATRSLEISSRGDRRVIEVSVETYDPRKVGARASADAGRQ